MQATEIAERAGAAEGEGKRIVGIERFRSEGFIFIDHCVRDVVVIEPFDRRSDWDRQFFRREFETVDGHGIGLFCCDGTERQCCTNEWAHYYCADHGARGNKSVCYEVKTANRIFHGSSNRIGIACKR
jgi:hypothetical protein